MKQMRIFLACTDERLKLALLMLLDHQPGMAVVGISDRLQGLFSQIVASQPDVIVLSWEEPLPVIADKITNIHSLSYPPKIIYLSSRANEKEEIMTAGADFFLVKDTPPDELLTILNNMRTLET